MVTSHKVVSINKTIREGYCLSVDIEELRKAQKVLNYSTFKLYLYLAGNSDKQELLLNQKTVEKAIGIRKTAYHDALRKLKELGYLIEKQFNRLVFFTSPVRSDGWEKEDDNFISFE